MKLIVSLLIACALFNKVYSLQCYECPVNPCTQKTVTCPPPKRCGSGSVLLSIGKENVSLSARDCVQPKQCISGSMNLGLVRAESNTKCCTTDLCNSEVVHEHKGQSFNGKKCFTCSGSDCTSTITCQGDENSCIKITTAAEGETKILKGCISSSFCDAADDAAQMLSALGRVSLDCCAGDLCNGAHSHTGLGLVLLLLLSVACASHCH